jgi:hypothetical protein
MKNLFFHDRFVHEVVAFEVLQVFSEVFLMYLLMTDQVQARVPDGFVEKRSYRN